MTEEENLNAIKEDMQKGNSPFDADEVFNKKMECYPSNAADTLEETFKKRHSDLVCGKEPLSPYFDLFSEGYELAETEGEKNYKHLKSLLYCTVRSCNNCGKVNCENFQRQRIDCCGLWVSYKDYIAKLEKENAELRKVAEFQQSSNMDTHLENKKLKETLTVGTTWNKHLISRNKFLEEESDKYRNMVFDKMEQIDKAVVLLKKWIEPKYDREELLHLTEEFLKEV